MTNASTRKLWRHWLGRTRLGRSFWSGRYGLGDVDESRLRSLENVHFLGGKPVDALPGYLKALDVALIPYKLNELTRNIFPLKLYEYLAAGLPIVAAALPELEPFAGTGGARGRTRRLPRTGTGGPR